MNFSQFTNEYSLDGCPLIRHAAHAFVTWVIHHASYVQGALVLGSSLRHYNPGILRICLLAEDLKTPAICDDLKLVFDQVVIVKTIKVETKYLKGNRFDHYYKDWINFSFTRLQCLRLKTLMNLSKIIVLDADTLVVRDLSQLFDIPAPAGILSFDEGYKFKDGTIMCHNTLHGQKIPSHYIRESIERSYGIRGCLLVLEPRDEDFANLIQILESESTSLPSAIGCYGDETCHIGPDEKLLTEYYHKAYQWTHIHQKYCITSWHLEQLKPERKEVPSCLHFVSQKPWVSKQTYYPDFDIWYLELLHLLALYPDLYSYYSDSALHRQQVDKFSTLSAKTLKAFFPEKTFWKQSESFTNLKSILNHEDRVEECIILDDELKTKPIHQNNCLRPTRSNNNLDFGKTPCIESKLPHNKSFAMDFQRLHGLSNSSYQERSMGPLRSPYNDTNTAPAAKRLDSLNKFLPNMTLCRETKETDNLLFVSVQRNSAAPNATSDNRSVSSRLLRKALLDISNTSQPCLPLFSCENHQLEKNATTNLGNDSSESLNQTNQ